jgi:hypothetical protein
MSISFTKTIRCCGVSWKVLVSVLGLSLAVLELRHSGEANKLREGANRYRGEANRLRDENNKLLRETLDLQKEIHQLQQDIEKKFTKVRLYAKVRREGDEPRLFISNLSEFDLWINHVKLVVTKTTNGQTGSHIIGGETRISHGHTEGGYKLHGALMTINGNRSDPFDMTFHVEVVAEGVADDPVTVNSLEYRFRVQGNTRELQVLNTQ